MEVPAGTLETLLREDGIHVPDSGSAERMIHCFTEGHEDNSSSMAVNVTKNVYHCHACKAKGNAWTYLETQRGLSKPEVARVLKRMGASEERIAAWARQHTQEQETRYGYPKHVRAVPDIDRGRKKIAEHDYRSEDGTLICRVARFETDPNKPGLPKCMPFTPRSEGGWWMANPLAELPPADRRCEQRPLYRLPELIANLEANPGRSIWIVEGEKCVDAVLGLSGPDLPYGPPPCTTSMFAKFDVKNTDLSPLEGQKVILMADQDEPGRANMLKLAAVLAGDLGCAVRTFLPPGDAAPRAKGYDVADAIYEGGWAAVLKWVEEVGSPQPYAVAQRPETDRMYQGPLEESEHFKVLGLYGPEYIAVRSKATHETHVMRRTVLNSEGNLLVLAPLEWWLEKTEGAGLGTTARRSFANALLRAAEKNGQVDLANLLGRGANKNGSKYTFNVGDKVLFEDDKGQLTEEVEIGKAKGLYQPGAAIQLKDDAHARKYTADLYKAVMGYRWHSPVDGRAFLGWIVSSIVGGALSFRPMIWISAQGGQGKSYLVEHILEHVLQGLLVSSNDATSAGLAGRMGNDSLPCCLDEFEPERGNEAKWINLLHLIRQSTSGNMARLRGSAGNNLTVSSYPRFSIFLLSVDRPRLSTADESRFFMLRLAEQGVSNWIKVRQEIEAAVDPLKMLAFRSFVIRNTAQIATKAREIEDDLQTNQRSLGTREAQIIAALTAGAGFMSGDYALVKRQQGVRDDTYAIFNTLLSALIRHDAGEMTLAEILRKGWWEDSGRMFIPDGHSQTYVALAARYGFRMASETSMYVATGCPTQGQLLNRTEYANVDLADHLRRLPGAKRVTTMNGGRKRIMFGGKRYETMLLGRDVLEASGFLSDGDDGPLALESMDQSYDTGPIPF